MNTTPLSALAEPNRLRIVGLLRDKPYSVGEIAERLELRQPQASKHLHVLGEAGLVRSRPEAQQRIYQLQSEPFTEIGNWLESFRRVRKKRLSAMDGISDGTKVRPSVTRQIGKADPSSFHLPKGQVPARVQKTNRDAVRHPA